MFSARDAADLDRFFRGLAEHAFHGRLGVVDPPLVEYVSSLLVRFIRSDGMPSPVAERGVATRLACMATTVRDATPETDGDEYRQIGDVTLFWTGLYPEALRREGRLDFRNVGKRAYWIASTLEPENVGSRDLLARLSHEFDVCVAGLAEVRRAWGE